MVGDILFDIDSTANTIDAQIQPGVIINADVNSSAAIDQSKLNMTAASTRASATGIAQADLGLASFDNSQFTSTNGWITVSNNGLLVGKIQQIGARTVLGNSSVTTDNVAAVNFSTVVDVGGAIKKSQYNTTGYLRRNNSLSSTLDSDYSIITDATDLTVNTLVKRDSNGDFAARTLTLQDIKLKLSSETSSSLTLARNSTATGGTTRLYAFNGQGGVLIGSGSLTADNTTYYDNNAHSFRTQDGFSAAPISCSRVTATALTTGADTTSGTITGQWILASTPGGSTKGNSRLQATYAADLAEFYEGDQEYEVGTVLVFGGDKEVTTTNSLGDTRVAGVVSDNAAYSMYGACPGFKNQIALQGRVPCKVVGKIKKGDILVTSKIPGVAIASTGDIKTGSSVGKALQEYDSDHIGTIEVAVGRT